MIDEQDVKDWERLPLVSNVITSAQMGAWLYYRDKRRDIQRDKQIRADALEEVYNRIDEGVCDICDCKDFDHDCYKGCQEETRVLKDWLKKQITK